MLDLARLQKEVYANMEKELVAKTEKNKRRDHAREDGVLKRVREG
jgi:hypothetical protein